MALITITRFRTVILKTVFLSAVITGVLPCHGQQPLSPSAKQTTIPATPVRSINPADTAFSDLQAFRQAVGNARIVLLGEQTHGEATTYEAKIRLVKFLHQQMGFEVLAFESGFYDCARIWENTQNGAALSKEITGSLFYMYATSKQMAPLFDYLQSTVNKPRELTVAGFESQHSGAKALNDLFPDFERFLQQKHPDLLQQNWGLFKNLSVATFKSRDNRPDTGDIRLFNEKLQVLQQTLAKDPAGSSSHLLQVSGFWLQVVNSIASQTSRYWGNVSGNELSVRDLQMAENLIWLAEKAYPGKKIIVWAHNIHVAKSTSGLIPPDDNTRAFLSTFKPMGATVSEHFGAKAYVIGFTSAAGTFMDYVSGKILPVPALKPGSLEAHLAATGHRWSFTDLRRKSPVLQQPLASALFDYSPATGIWPAVYDGLFFIKTAAPVAR
ncbi:erythromycin esterase family protein [Chitinophaga nivalis]|uniref:Erythromycin esterase family protein n=1 Tax=Chitinophaga nivalis TaxID=2991709 RepID=A0ABT3IER9_9BACT|nr:erythromycin esterase family protein [Chitinophaga nivalis]MCW3467860.1 erythromycin esterase family protein [Chitinophaga nivalis]MCW3482448.1 erythromycin esterase family protein [Chitinophaga nivalis]